MTTQINETAELMCDLVGSLALDKIELRSVGGTWVTGTMGKHRFEALVFPDHASCQGYELHDSRISKLWIQRLADKTVVACFDRGWDCKPKTEVAGQIVELLAAGLAEHVFGD